jgi:transposase
MPGITVNDVELRHALKADHLSAWRTLARKGKLAVPVIAGAAFDGPVSIVRPVAIPVAAPWIDLICGLVTVRLDAATPEHGLPSWFRWGAGVAIARSLLRL